ncbi:MAG: hypothetical protein ACLGI8_00435 [Acidimicrobiia bacterium]
MRLLQLATGRDHLLDLHPQMSVIRSLDPEARGQLVAAVVGLARHECIGTGLLEAHGVLFDLDPALLRLLDGPAEVDPVVRPIDLPGAPPVDDPALREQQDRFDHVLARIASAVEVQERATVELEAAAAALDDARRAVEEATSRRQELEARAATRRAEAGAPRDRTEVVHPEPAGRSADQHHARRNDARSQAKEARQARVEAEAALRAAEAELARRSVEHRDLVERQEALRRRLDPAAAERLEAARAALIAASSRPGPTGVAAEGEATHPDGPGDEQRRSLIARVAVLDEVLDELDRLDPAPVEAALAAARVPPVLVPSAEAGELADRLASLAAEIAASAARGVPDLSAVDAAAAAERLDAARAAVADAEDAARALHLAAEDAEALEAAHARLHDALERADSRVGGIRARGQVDRLRAEEQELLDRLGFVTYAEYLMGTSAAHRDPEAEEALAEARQRLAEAEAAWADLEAQRRAVLAHAQLLDRRRNLVARAEALLGRPVDPDEALVAALRSHLVPEAEAADRVQVLVEALVGAGVELDPEGLDREDLEVIAEAWLAEASSVATRRVALEQDRAAAQAALDALEEAGADTAPGAPTPDPATAPRDAAPSPEDPDAEVLEEVRRAVEEVQDRWEAHETATAALAEGEAELEALTAAVSEAEQALTGAQAAALDAAEAAEVAAARSLAELEAEVGAGPVDAGGLDAAPDDAPSERALAAAREAEASAEGALERAEVAHHEARRALEAAEAEVAELTQVGEAAAAELEQLQERHRAMGDGPAPDPAELEWYLVARVAAQRSVSVAGSTPLLLDDPFRGLSDSQIHHLLGRLERVAETVQIIVLSDHPAVASWVEEAGEARAAVVEPSAADA